MPRTWSHLCLTLLFCLGFLAFHPAAGAQQTLAVLDLPDAPGRFSPPQASPQTLPQRTGKPAATLTGHIVDVANAPVPNANITLVGRDGNNETVVHSDSNGNFTFDALPPADVRLTVTAAGFETFISPDMKLTAGEHLTVPEVVLPIEPNSSRIEVTVTEEQVAQGQMKEEEKQRAFGVLPNFYTSYTWDAAPLNFRQKSELAFRSTTDPVEFVVVGAIAGVEQARNTFPGYHQGAVGYGRRYGAAYGDLVISRVIGSAILPALFHQDPRYFYKGSGTIRSRVEYALAASVICKGNNGHFQFNYSRLIGSAAAGAISRTYHPGSTSAELIFRNVGVGIGGSALTNLFREFLLRRFTPSVPDYEQGKPLPRLVAPEASPSSTTSAPATS